MDTSAGVRMTMVALVIGAVCVIGAANLLLLARIVGRRRTSRTALIVWPSLLALVAFCIFCGFRIEPNWTQVTHRTIETTKLPPGSRLRIVHLTDIHLDRISTRNIQMVNLTAFERPDVILLTGDYTIVKDRTAARHLEQLAVRLSRVAPTYAVDGNWDIEDDMRALKKGGVTLLDNWITVKAKRGGRVAIGQVSWLAGELPPPPKSTGGLFRVLMCHIPCHVDYAKSHAIDLMLTGHTHGGQVRLPIFGALLPDRQLVGKYQAGSYKEGSTLLYVNRGIGMEGGAAPKVRFCCPPEVAVFDIVGKKHENPQTR